MFQISWEKFSTFFRRLRFWTKKPPKNDPDASIALQLPPELVGHIMAIVVHNHFFADSILYPRSYAWIKLCHICRSWRQIALGCPVLWSYIDTRWDTLVSELILRSQSASLTVCVCLQDICAPSGVISINKALGEMHRIKELHLIGHEMDLHYPDLQIPLEAPRLEVLSLESLDRSIFAVPRKLLKTTKGLADRLTSLSLTNISMASIPFNRQIRSLQYLRIFPKTICHTNLSDIITVLSLCPDLTEFEYISRTNIVVPSAAETRTVNLHRLRNLRLSTNTTASIFLLNHIHAPLNICLSISGVCALETYEPLSIPQRYLLGYEFLRIRIGHTHTDDAFSLSTSAKYGHSGEPHRDTMEVYIEKNGFRTLSAALSDLLPRIRHVELNDHELIRNEGAYDSFITTLHSVEILNISFKWLKPAMSLIYSMSGSSTGITCPNLRTLILQVVILEFEIDMVFVELTSFLRSRNDSSAHQMVLDLSLCRGISPGHVQIDIMRSLVELLILPE
ncbi:hypothetical protein BD410DRAFT_900192 [Rickenella mellea]|uniref:Uncharacterized protein n=1 Tax=Rickenella mellea TaxID=50990 RepID=A0A4Y7PWJ6_9AGAM|nr:hypothetical protein BD410DRAFT_900192 [Rickenella mellea]